MLLKWSTPGTMVGSLGAHDLANGIYGRQGLLLEMVLTFVLVFVIFGVAVDRRGPGYQSTTSSKNQYYYNLWVDFSSKKFLMNLLPSFPPPPPYTLEFSIYLVPSKLGEELVMRSQDENRQ